MGKIFAGAGSIFLFLIFAKPAFAVSFTFDDAPSSIYFEDSFIVNTHLQITNSSGKIYFIKGTFSNLQTPTSYFGYTKNNDGNWHSGSDKNGYYKITMDENGEWKGAVEVKLDPEDPGYKGGGNYNFKLGRYTEGGSSPTYCDKEAEPCSVAIINVTAPTPTPTATPTTKPTSTPKPTKEPTPTKSSITASQTQSSSTLPSSAKITQKATINPSKVPTPVLGASASASKKATKSGDGEKEILVEGASENKFRYMALGIGIISTACAILFFLKIRRGIINNE